ncbi:hypothetical protein ACC728_39200, partial [Rhizobium ruizarguesonis]
EKEGGRKGGEREEKGKGEKEEEEGGRKKEEGERKRKKREEKRGEKRGRSDASSVSMKRHGERVLDYARNSLARANEAVSR